MLAVDAPLEDYRVELTGYCYRMLGSAFEAQDAVQETLVRAWRSVDRFEGRSSLRSWLYRIATNVCINMLNGTQRRALPMDLTASSPGDGALTPPLADSTWVQPIPDRRVVPDHSDPGELAASQESIRLAFVVALQYLPPRQRAVLILRDVLRWSAAEVAELLDTTIVSVKSTLQRARATLATIELPSARSAGLDDAERALLARYVDAFERYDIEALVSLLHDEATLSMPPHPLWLRGPGSIRSWWLREDAACRGSRLVPVSANGSSAYAQYRPGVAGGPMTAFAIQVVTIADGAIIAIDTFIEPRLFALFDLPLALAA